MGRGLAAGGVEIAYANMVRKGKGGWWCRVRLPAPTDTLGGRAAGPGVFHQKVGHMPRLPPVRTDTTRATRLRAISPFNINSFLRPCPARVHSSTTSS